MTFGKYSTCVLSAATFLIQDGDALKIVHAVLHTHPDAIGEAPLFVWMEPGERTGSISRPRNQHPYALTSTQTEAELRRSFSSAIACYGARLGLVLPSDAGEPTLHTPQLTGDKPLRLWFVDGVWVHRKSALAFMEAVHQLPADNPHLRISPELAALAQFTQWVIHQVDRLQVIPDLVYQGRPSFATWRLAPTGALEEILMRFAEAMPTATVALSRFATWLLAGDVRSLKIEALDAYAALIVDATVRERLSARGGAYPHSSNRLVERWVEALQTPDGAVYASPALQQLASAIATWHSEGQKAAALRLPLRLVLQLAPVMPTRSDTEVTTPTGWRLHYAVHDPDQPAEPISAEAVWSHPDERYPTTLSHLLERAGRVFEPIARSVANPHPAGCELTSDEAAVFVYEAADRLAAAGVLIQLPTWMERRPEPIRTRLVVEPGAGILSVDSLVSYEWQASIGEHQVDAEEFARLTEARLPFVRLGNEWVVLEPEELRRLVERAERSGSRHKGKASVLDLAWQQLDDDVEVTFRPGENLERLHRLMAALGKERKWELLPPPKGLQAELRPYQQRGYSWLMFMRQYGLGACLADDMGLGKTLQVIALFQHEKEQGRMGTALVVCPTSVVENWRRELARFAPGLTVYVHHGKERLRDDELRQQAEAVDVVLTSFGLVLRDRETLRQIEWDTVVVDEAQNLKNPMAKQTRSLKLMQAAHRIALTGTPVENRLSELWSIFDFLSPGYMGSLTYFRQSIATPIERHRDTQALEYLQRRIHPFILRRSKSDPDIAPELPDKLESKVYCTLTTEQAAMYQAVVDQMMHRIEGATGMKRRGLVLASLTRLKQICNHPALFLKQESAQVSRSGKMRELLARVREVREQGESALIFTQYAQMGSVLQKMLSGELGEEVLFLHGGVPRTKRDELIIRFQKGHAPLFVLSLRAGGVGLNLTRATHVFHFDRWWNPAVENQATDRAYRIGQDRQVNVYKFICTGTLEDHIDRLIEAKRSLAQNVIVSGEQWLSELSNDELRHLFTLERTGVR